MNRQLVAFGLAVALTLGAAAPAVAGAAQDAALALGAFAVFNQIVRGETVFQSPPPAVVVPPPVVYAPAPVVYVPLPVVYAPPPVVYAPPPAVVYPLPPVVQYPGYVYLKRGAHWGWVPRSGYWAHGGWDGKRGQWNGRHGDNHRGPDGPHR